MKILVSCFKCTIEDPANFHFKGYLTLNEDGFYQFTCPKGHLNLKEIQAFKFELLFESGLYAIKDHYYLESVLSLNASLERFYEFAIQILLRANGMTKNEYDNMYKIISRQSERQLGAFISLFSNSFSETPKMVKGKHVEFRNKVVHKGFLPDEKDVLNFAEEIFVIIKSSYIPLLESYKSVINNCIHEDQLKRREKHKEVINSSKSYISTTAPCLALTHTLNIESFKNKKFESCWDYVLKNLFHA